jgi:hypothetical protein
MRIPEDEERPLAWNAILENTPVYSADDQRVGAITEVVGAEDIFHGIEVKPGVLGDTVLVPAADVLNITNRRINIRLSAEEFRRLPAYVAEDSFRLGFVGLLTRGLGWVRSGDEG